MNNKTFGDIGEELAARYLAGRRWHILARNYLVRGGELDIVGYRFGVLAFFEVKTRSSDSYGAPADAVDGEKLRRLEKAARAFRAAHESGGKVPVFYGKRKIMRRVRERRVDVIEVYLTRDLQLKEINHVRKAEIL